MKRSFLFLLILLLFIQGISYSQVLVNGVDEENYNSSPRDEDGNIIGPETDGVFQTFGKAVEFLMEYGNGGTVTIASVGGHGVGVANKPLTVIGANENQPFDGEIQMTGAKLTLRNLKMQNGLFEGQSAVFLFDGELDAQNIIFDQRGIQESGSAASTITVKDCVFINAKANGLAAFSPDLTVDFQNVEFKDFDGFNKCLAILPANGHAEVLVKDCTFTNCFLGVDDRHTQGEAIYQNLSFTNMSHIGINVEWDPGMGIYGNARTVITNCAFDTCGYQGVHTHSPMHVIVSECTARNCGAGSPYRGDHPLDGAGFGGHHSNTEGGGHLQNSDVVFEDCESNNNVGNGFAFTEDKGITLRNNVANDNQLNGIRFEKCEDVSVENGTIASGNEQYGVTLDVTKNWKIHNGTFGLNRQRNEAKANKSGGVRLLDCGDGELGSVENPIKGNVISGNEGPGINIYLMENEESSRIKIGSNNIGTDGDAAEVFPNTIGIQIMGNGSVTGIPFVEIGGQNPSMENHLNPDRGVGNIIAGNSEEGILIKGSYADGLEQGRLDIWGNYIGAVQAGSIWFRNWNNGIKIIPNKFLEINIGSKEDKSKGNLISGNDDNGIFLDGNESPGEGHRIEKVRIVNNLIGTGLDGEARVPNGLNGIRITDGGSEESEGIDVKENVIAENTIKNNEECGIIISGTKAVENHITENSIHRNDLKGIRIENGANKGISVALDHTIDSVTTVNKIFGKASVPNTEIEIFSDPIFNDTDPGYWGQGKKFIRKINADDKGKFEIDLASIPDPGMITVTATDEDKNTSEFSPFASLAVTQVVGKEGKYLVANKPMVARIFANTGKDTQEIDVTGNLTVNESAAALEPASFKMKPFGGYRGSFQDRRDAKSSLNFYFQDPPVGEHDIEVTLMQGSEERGKFKYGLYNFQRTQNRTMGYVPVLAPPQAGGAPSEFPDFAYINQAVAFFADVYPVDPDEFKQNFRMLYPIVLSVPPHSKPLWRELVETADAFRLMSRPVVDYAMVAIAHETAFRSATDTYFTFGFTYPHKPNVIASIDAYKRVAPPIHSGDTLAHEVGHTVPFSLSDTYSGGTQKLVGGEIRNPTSTNANRTNGTGNFIQEEDFAFSPTGVFDNQVPPKKQAVFSDIANARYVYDIMGNSAPAWWNSVSYKVLFKELGGRIEEDSAKVMRPQQETLSSTIQVLGEITQNNQALLRPLLFSDETIVRPENTLGSQGYHVDLLDTEGNLLDSQAFTGGFESVEVSGIDPVTGLPIRSWETEPSFVFSVFLINDPLAVRIEIKLGDQLLGELDKSANSPSVTNLSGLESGELPSEPFDLSWQGSDPDPDDTLYYYVLYSPDGGTTIVPVAADLEGITTIPVYPQYLQTGSDPRFTIRVSDGWNQSDTNSKKLSLDDRIPQATIEQPRNNVQLSNQLPVTLIGAAYDPEDGFISGEQLEWYIDDKPELAGTGRSIRAGLSLGKHTIKLIATDSAGNQGIAEVTIEVTENPSTGLKSWKLHE